MPRARRHFIPGHIWHITHRCHKKEFLLRFAKDRRRWLHWLFEAKKRYGLVVLNFMVTSNHIHMVRAGVVKHPSEWEFSGYHEIQNPRKRKRIVDFDRLMDLLGIQSHDELKDSHNQWVDSAMQTGDSCREDKWTQSIAVGSKSFVEKMKESLGFRAVGRRVICADDTFELREGQTSYGQASDLEGSTFLWDQPPSPLNDSFFGSGVGPRFVRGTDHSN